MPARTSRLLIDEPPLQVLPSLAVTVGLNEAIFIQQVHYWLQISKHVHDGRRWIYNTYDGWQVQMPFWSARTIRRIVGDLEARGVILSTSEYNQTRIDKTKWYTIDYDALDRLLESADHVANLAARTGQDAQMDAANLSTPIPETFQKTNDKEIARSFLIPELGVSSDALWTILVDDLAGRGVGRRQDIDQYLRPARLARRVDDRRFEIMPENDIARRRLQGWRDEIRAALARLLGGSGWQVDVVDRQDIA